jgi:hypothetical protein
MARQNIHRLPSIELYGTKVMPLVRKSLATAADALPSAGGPGK